MGATFLLSIFASVNRPRQSIGFVYILSGLISSLTNKVKNSKISQSDSAILLINTTTHH